MTDISELSREELEELRIEIDQRLVELDKQQRAEALSELREVAARHGIPMAEMLQMARDSASPSGALPKFRDPENPDNTWTGRGRKPKWLVAALEAGAELETFAI